MNLEVGSIICITRLADALHLALAVLLAKGIGLGRSSTSTPLEGLAWLASAFTGVTVGASLARETEFRGTPVDAWTELS